MLEIRDLSHGYGGRRVLQLPRWDVPAGARRAVLGPSGSGKTTLLAILGGLVRPGAGTVRVGGHDIAAMPPSALDAWRARHVGVVLQSPHLLAPLDALENVLVAQYLAGRAADSRQARGLLDALGVGHRAAARPHQLSRGEQQRVAIARAVVNRPALVLADEPTANLDDASCDAVLALLDRAAGEAVLIVATHDARVKSRFPERLALEPQA